MIDNQNIDNNDSKDDYKDIRSNLDKEYVKNDDNSSLNALYQTELERTKKNELAKWIERLKTLKNHPIFTHLPNLEQSIEKLVVLRASLPELKAKLETNDKAISRIKDVISMVPAESGVVDLDEMECRFSTSNQHISDLWLSFINEVPNGLITKTYPLKLNTSRSLAETDIMLYLAKEQNMPQDKNINNNDGRAEVSNGGDFYPPDYFIKETDRDIVGRLKECSDRFSRYLKNLESKEQKQSTSTSLAYSKNKQKEKKMPVKKNKVPKSKKKGTDEQGSSNSLLENKQNESTSLTSAAETSTNVAEANDLGNNINTASSASELVNSSTEAVSVPNFLNGRQRFINIEKAFVNEMRSYEIIVKQLKDMETEQLHHIRRGTNNKPLSNLGPTDSNLTEDEIIMNKEEKRLEKICYAAQYVAGSVRRTKGEITLMIRELNSLIKENEEIEDELCKKFEDTHVDAEIAHNQRIKLEEEEEDLIAIRTDLIQALYEVKRRRKNA